MKIPDFIKVPECIKKSFSKKKRHKDNPIETSVKHSFSPSPPTAEEHHPSFEEIAPKESPPDFGVKDALPENEGSEVSLLETKTRFSEAKTRLLRPDTDAPESEADFLGFERQEATTLLAQARFASAKEILQVFREIVERVKDYHEQGLAVLNLSPSSIRYKPEISLDTKYLTYFGHKPEHSIDTGFTAPEVAMGSEIDKAADVYALGCLLYWMLTGRTYDSFKDQDFEHVSPIFQRILKGCLTIDRDYRFQTIEDLIFTLDHIERELAPVISTRVVALSTIGNNLGREVNEDSICYLEENSFLNSSQEFRGLYAIIDGMGGLIQGRQASQIASLSFQRQFRDAGSSFDPKAFIANANNEILEKLTDGGAAASVLLVHNNYLKLAHLGDTRVYLFREGEVYKLTMDHSLPYLLYFNGMITKEDLRGHKDRNQLTNYLGMPNLRVETIFSLSKLRDDLQKTLDIQGEELSLKDGDILLLCSDGLWDWWEDHLSPEEEVSYLSSVIFGDISLEGKARRLLWDALQKDGSDNISLLLVQFSILDRAKSWVKDNEGVLLPKL